MRKARLRTLYFERTRPARAVVHRELDDAPPLPHEQRPQETVHAVEARQVPQALAAKRL